MTISDLYLLSFIFSIVFFLVAIFIQKERLESIFSLLFLVMVIVHAGYYALSISTNLQEAILAYKITYFDGTIVPFMTFLCILKICGIKKPKFTAMLSVLPVTSLLLGYTAGLSPIYYDNIQLFHKTGYNYIVRGHGPLHFIGTVCLISVMASSFCVVVYAFFNRNKISYRYSLYCTAVIAINAAFYFIRAALGVDFELSPFQYNVTEILMLVIMNNIGMHEIDRDAYLTKSRLREYGYFAFDQNECFLGYDESAKYFFPELTKLSLDANIASGFIRDEFVVWDNYRVDEDGNKFKYFNRCGRDIKCTRKQIIGDKAGSFHGYIVEIHDDTEHVKYVERLHKMNEELAEAVETAKRADQSKSLFLSRMSHEIRTPINAIIGLNEVILRETAKGSIRGYSKTIRNSANMLLALVNDVLDFSKIESGKMEIVEDNYEEESVITTSIDMVKQRAVNKGLELKVEIDGDIPARLYGDNLKIQQILINLLTNAIKYTESGSILLKVSSSPQKYGKTEMRYSVIDTGIGIKEEDLTGLFDAFTRKDLKRNNSIEGTGLGLSITSSYAKMLGGHIEVKSNFGEGSEFTAVIPQKVVSDATICQETVDRKSNNAAYGEEESYHLITNNTKIIVVDDNRTNLDIFSLLLKPIKAEIKSLTSGKELISFLEGGNEDFDIIFLDHMMPEPDGIETLKIIRERGLLDSSKPIIALTANAISSARNLYLDAGFTDYLSKPINPKALEAMIIKYLPEEKYELEESSEEEESAVTLIELDEFDFAEAVKKLGSEEIVREIAKEVCKSLPKSKKKLINLFETIEDPQSLNDYRIEVHSLKSSLATIGGMLLSKLCRVAEVAAIESDIEKIKLIHPIVIDEIDKHYNRLMIFEDENSLEKEDEVQKEISEDNLKKLLNNVKGALEDWDYDLAEKIINEIEGYRLEGPVADEIADIKEYVHDFNGAYAIERLVNILLGP